MELTEQEVKDILGGVGDCIDCDYDYTQSPVFPAGRHDVCAVVRTTEDGNSTGYDTIYIVWKMPDDSVRHKKIKDSKKTKAYIHIKWIKAQGDNITVRFFSGGSHGDPWIVSKKFSMEKLVAK